MEGKDRWYKQGPPLLGEIKRAGPGPGAAHVWFMGQHGFVIALGGLVCYIDVILNPLPGGGGRDCRAYPPPFGPEQADRVDYYLCTHDHADHLNLNTLLPLAKANPRVRFIVPQPCRTLLTAAGIGETRVLGAEAHKTIALSTDAAVIPVPAVHTPFIQKEGEKDALGRDACLGFVLRGSGLSIYHAGDTWITAGLAAALKTLGPLDMAMLPINGTDWERTADNCVGNGNAMDAVKLALAVPIDLVIPAHYDMLPGNTENPAYFADCMYRWAPQKRFHICALGERFVYEKSADRH